MTTYVPDTNNDCIKKTISYIFLGIIKFQAANEMKSLTRSHQKKKGEQHYVTRQQYSQWTQSRENYQKHS